MITRTQVLMGTFVDVTLEDFNASTQVFKEIKTIEKHLSSYDSSSHLFRLNQEKSIPTDSILKEALKKSIDYYYQTNGYFDITIGSMSKNLYHFGEEVQSPSTDALQNALLDINAIIIDDKNISLTKDITLDLGGMGKGFAIDKVSHYLKKRDITQGKIALSGDILCLDSCEIYIQSPFKEEVFAKLTTKQPFSRISTSGTYRRFATTPKEHHLLNPKKRRPQQNFLSLSLFSKGNNSQLDAYATAISVMPLQEALSFLEKHKKLSYLLITSTKEIKYRIDPLLFELQLLSSLF